MKASPVRLLVVLFFVLIAASPRAQCAVLIVGNTQDSGNGSLRYAITGASAGDTVEFNIPTSDPGYNSSTGLFTITLTTGEIVIDRNLNIAAPNRNIVISGNQTSRIFNITTGVVAISDLTMIDGKTWGASGALPTPSPGPGGPGNGGAILNQGTLTITRCTLRGNIAVGGHGSGGLGAATEGGDGQGGAIANQGAVSLVACTLNANTALGGPGGTGYTSNYTLAAKGGVGSGGAIYNAATGALNLSNCTITANNAIGPDGKYASISIRGAAARGGGIANFGSLTIVHCTVANNAALGGASNRGQLGAFGPYDGGSSSGGGLYCAVDSISGIRDVIFAPNRTIGGAPSEPPALVGAAIGPDVSGTMGSVGNNVIGRSDGCAGLIAADQRGGTTDETRLDPMLGDLANNGGPTETLALLPGSPAIDAGALPGEDRDQRYFLRAGSPDVGAFEYQGTQPVMLANISTRMRIGTGDNAMIGGFIVTGTEPKTVVIRGIGPSISVAGALADPIIELHGPSGALLVSNDDWESASTSQEIIGGGLAPANALESALWERLDPGAYSVVVRGKNDTIGVALFEVYDLDQTADSKLANVATRGFVETGDDVMIGGIIIVGTAPRVLFRAIGPSLSGNGVPDALGNPTMEIYNASGQLIAMNDDWQTDQLLEIIGTGIPPSNDLESAIVSDLVPGPYTAVVRGKNETTGVALIEVYDLN